MRQPDVAGVRAAQYLRMSTEHQNYSIRHQAAAIADYAAQRGWTLVRSYVDAGVSGLRLDRREGLKALLADVLGGQADFSAVLVYDVSRWGRFQDPDQSAHYEFLCREAGVRIEYCAEPFVNDGSLAATLVKHLKRAMAAEYSRELSDKIARAQRALAARGYWQGGPPGFGLRRQPEGRGGKVRRVLEAGEHNGNQGERVVLVHGPPEEVALVREIYRLFLICGLSSQAIARQLNDQGTAASAGRLWTTHRVRKLLQSQKYAGTLETAKSRSALGSLVRAPRDQWVRTAGAVPAIISREIFDQVQAQFRRRRRDDEELIAILRRLLADHGRLTQQIIADDPRAPGPQVFAARFGSLEAAYGRAGYKLSRQQAAAVARRRAYLARPKAPALTDEAVIALLRALRRRYGHLSVDLIDSQLGVPKTRNLIPRFGSLTRVYELAGHTPTCRQVVAMHTAATRRLSGRGPKP